MDFQEFGIDARLAAAIQDCGTSAFFFEKLLSHSLKNGENVCARITLDAGREEVILLPALQWLLSASGGERRKVLVAAPDGQGARRIADAAARIGGAAGIGACAVDSGEPPASASAAGEPDAAVLVGTPEALLAASAEGLINLRDYGFLIVDGADRLAERPSELMRKLAGMLRPSWERRSILACARITVKAKNLAWDLSDNPCEISIEGEVAKAQSVAKETWRVATDAKVRFLIACLEREKAERVCVFCNLKDTAEELSKRLEANGLASDYILGALAADRKLAVLGKVEAGSRAALILTDKGAEGLPPGRFPLVVNFDFPLEPELFVKRLEMLDRSADGAKVVSIACDRYIYGLSAVESYIDARLDAKEADESLLAPEDKSAGMSFERRSDGREYRGRGDRDGENRGREDRREPRYPSREDRGRRDGGRRNGYREDRGPDIRRSISEATGGSLDVGGDAAAGRLPDRGGPAAGKSAGVPRSSGGPRDGRRDGRRPEQRANRRPDRPSSREERGDRGPARDRGKREDRPSGNPYELPMEERMKRYREKYGQRVAGPAKRGPGPNQPELRSQGIPDGGAERSPSGRGGPRTAPKPEGKAPGSDGLFGRFLGSLRRKQE